MIFPWPAMLGAALRLGLSPQAFWQLSVREWRWLAGGQAGLSRTGLEALMVQFPDKAEGGENGRD